MSTTSKKERAVRERTRRKYLRTRGRPLEQKKRQNRIKTRLANRKTIEERMKEARRRKLLADIKKERNPEKLEKKVDKARIAGLEGQISQEDKNRLEKYKKAKEHVKEAIRDMKSREASATQKEAVQKIKMGRSDGAMHQLKESATDSAVGNDTGRAEGKLAQELKTLEKVSGKHTDSIMQKTLREHSVPADTFNQEKRADKGDRNLENKRTQDSTMKQMVAQKMRERRMRG